MTAERDAAEVLAAHVSWTSSADGCMGCDWKPDSLRFVGAQHRAHVAAALAAAGLLRARDDEEGGT